VIRKILIAITSLHDAVSNREPFIRELDALRAVSQDLPLVRQALETIPESIAEKGVANAEDITSRFSPSFTSCLFFLSPLSFVLSLVHFSRCFEPMST